MKTPTERSRVFFALWPPGKVASRLAELGEAASPSGARCMRTDTLHLTLAFVGDIETTRLPELIEIGDRISWPRFDLMIDQVLRWSHNRIIFAAPSRTPVVLSALAGSLEKALREQGICLPERRFVPHVTLARSTEGIEAPLAPIDVAWSVDGGVLVSSDRTHEGACYRVLKYWPAD